MAAASGRGGAGGGDCDGDEDDADDTAAAAAVGQAKHQRARDIMSREEAQGRARSPGRARGGGCFGCGEPDHQLGKCPEYLEFKAERKKRLTRGDTGGRAAAALLTAAAPAYDPDDSPYSSDDDGEGSVEQALVTHTTSDDEGEFHDCDATAATSHAAYNGQRVPVGFRAPTPPGADPAQLPSPGTVAVASAGGEQTMLELCSLGEVHLSGLPLQNARRSPLFPELVARCTLLVVPASVLVHIVVR